MLLGVTLLKKKYPLAKYLCVLLIVAGVALFMYKPKKVVGIEEHTVGFGELLLVCSPILKAAFSSRFYQGQPLTRQAESQGRACCPLTPSCCWSLLKGPWLCYGHNKEPEIFSHS
jgi:hypothetical protein